MCKTVQVFETSLSYTMVEYGIVMPILQANLTELKLFASGHRTNKEQN